LTPTVAPTTTTDTPTTLTPTTLTPTATPTTTLAPGYYRALSCADGVTEIFSTLSVNPLFNSGDRVLANGSLPYVVNGFQTNNPGGTLYVFTATAEFGCPATTITPTATPTTLVPTTTSTTTATPTATPTTTITPTDTPTTTVTPTAAPGYFRALSCADGVTHIFSTQQPAGTFNSGDRILGNDDLPYVVDGFQTNNPGGTLNSFYATGQTGCPTTTLTPTATPTTLVPTTTSTTTATPTATPTTITPTDTPTTTTTTTATPTTTLASATLAWSYSETGGADGVMDLYVNGTIVETRMNTSNGTYTVYVGDTIAMDLNMNQCTGGDTYSNVYTSGIISDAACTNNGTAALFTNTYTVVNGDIGTTIYFNGFASCEAACL
jgi:hypothetical protein